MAISDKERRKHLRSYAFLQKIAAPVASWFYGYKFKGPRIDIEGPYIVLCNHNLDFDPMFVGLSFKQQMYFVASEHLFRQNFISRLLVNIFDPIARKKGTTAASTVVEMARRARAGYNLALFPEGDRSFTGRTDRIHPTVGKLVKKLNIKVVTFRIRGGFLTNPRWSGGSIRKGRMRGELVNVYDKDQVNAMSADELVEKISNDLFVDAYADQKEAHIAYKGKDLAEGLETGLWICPECGKIGTMHSHGNTLSCECGMTVTYDEYGMMHGGRFDTFTEWYDWQREEYDKRIDAGTVEMPDDEVTVVELNGEEQTEVARGRLQVGKNLIRLLRKSGESTDIDDVHSIAMYGANHIVFEAGKKYYEVLAEKRFCARKYIKMLCRLSNIETGI